MAFGRAADVRLADTTSDSKCVVGLGGLEPPTPRLSSVCSNQLSYRPRCPIQDGEMSANSDICHLTSVICTAADRLWTLRGAEGHRSFGNQLSPATEHEL